MGINSSGSHALLLIELSTITVVFFCFFFVFIYLFLAVWGLHCCTRAFSSCGERGPLPVAMRGPLTVVASPAVEHGL